MSAYECRASLPQGEFQAQATIEADAIALQGESGQRVSLPFADLLDMRLLNYRLRLDMRDSEVQISHLGYQTEEFFEKLWQAYCAKSRESLFVAGAFIMESEGDYSYTEPQVQRSSIAKLELYSDCLCIVPHDAGARRVALCFAEPPVREGFALTIPLDTGEVYRIARLGSDTDPFFTKLVDARDESVASWREAQRALEDNLPVRLGEAAEAHKAFRSLNADVTCGLFSADEEAFWFMAVADGRAAIELVTDEKAATYLYRFSTSQSEFEGAVRHAMEAVKKNRRIIFLAEEDLPGEPLYRMAIERSSHVRFLRSCNVGRIIHTSSWATKLSEFFA